MELLSSILDNTGAYLAAHTALAYFVLFFGSYFETLIGIGFFIYGEIFFIPGALLAGAGVLDIWLVSAALILGGIAGDTTSFFIGRRYGTSFFSEHGRFFNHTNYQKGMAFFDKYGTKTVFFARFLGPVSWITPFLAGIYGVPYRAFLPYNIAGVTLGIGQFLVAGYVFGANYRTILAVLRQDALIVASVAALVLLGWYIYKRNRG